MKLASMPIAVQAPPPTEAPQPKRIRGLVRGKIKNPFKLFLYGIEGVGKSTFAAAAPSALFIGKQAGTEQLDIARLPEPRAWKDDPEGLDVFSLVREAASMSNEFKTLVIDTVDWIQPLVEEYVCKTSKDKNGNAKPCNNIILAHGGYGNGYKVAADEWREFLQLLEKVRVESQMNIILLGHAVIKKVQNPEGPDYDQWNVAMQDKSAEVIRQWSDAVLFASREAVVVKEKENGKGGVAYGEADRFLFTEWRPSSVGKNRYGLPERLPLDFATFYNLWQSHQESAGPLQAEATKLIETFPEDTRGELTASLGRCGDDVTKLNQLVNWLRTESNNV